MIPRMTLFLTVALGSFSAQAQTCNLHIRESTPASQFVVNANGTVLDKTTGLMWKRCTEGQSGAGCATGSVALYNWQGALAQAANSAYAGYKDWRLPNAKELESLVEEKCYNPSINLSVFPGISSEYWASSASNLGSVWNIDFNKGSFYADDNNSDFAVRLVRSGQ
jgi:hypothetical protein